MPVFEALDASPIDWPEQLAVTCTSPIRVNLRATSALVNDDFLRWSRRQKDAEVVVEYDV